MWGEIVCKGIHAYKGHSKTTEGTSIYASCINEITYNHETKEADDYSVDALLIHGVVYTVANTRDFIM